MEATEEDDKWALRASMDNLEYSKKSFYPSQKPNFAPQSSDPRTSQYTERDIPAPIYKKSVKQNCASNSYNVPWDEQVFTVRALKESRRGNIKCKKTKKKPFQR